LVRGFETINRRLNSGHDCAWAIAGADEHSMQRVREAANRSAEAEK
jgi:hypothetical protein